MAGDTQSSMDREHDLRTVLGADLHKAVTASKVLVVGAGGIGCELLKNLVLSGFTNIVVVDLDTIDVSNLNRQFLFRKKHVDMPKSFVARDAILEFNPAAKVCVGFTSFACCAHILKEI